MYIPQKEQSNGAKRKRRGSIISKRDFPICVSDMTTIEQHQTEPFYILCDVGMNTES